MNTLKTLIAATVLVSPAVTAATYTYTGNDYVAIQGVDYYDTSMHLSISFTTELPLVDFAGDAASLITGYVFNDGVSTYTGEEHETYQFLVATDSAGEIIAWEIGMQAYGGQSEIIEIGDEYYSFSSTGRSDLAGYNTCNELDAFGRCITQINAATTKWLADDAGPGTWTVTPSSVPVPAAAWLFGSAMLGLVGAAQRKNIFKQGAMR